MPIIATMKASWLLFTNGKIKLFLPFSTKLKIIIYKFDIQISNLTFNSRKLKEKTKLYWEKSHVIKKS